MRRVDLLPVLLLVSSSAARHTASYQVTTHPPPPPPPCITRCKRQVADTSATFKLQART
jgi:hypothetical protein